MGNSLSHQLFSELRVCRGHALARVHTRAADQDRAPLCRTSPGPAATCPPRARGDNQRATVVSWVASGPGKRRRSHECRTPTVRPVVLADTNFSRRSDGFPGGQNNPHWTVCRARRTSCHPQRRVSSPETQLRPCSWSLPVGRRANSAFTGPGPSRVRAHDRAAVVGIYHLPRRRRAGNSLFRCCTRPVSASTSSTSSAGNDRATPRSTQASGTKSQPRRPRAFS